MTWKEFIEGAEKRGVKGDMELWYIDVTFPEHGHINVELPDSEGDLRIWG